jgi:hypothetical protein
MGRSSLFGTEPAKLEHRGRDTTARGPGDAPDLWGDTVFDPSDPLADEPADDTTDVGRAQIPLPLPENEDENADPVCDGHSDAEAAQAQPRKQPRRR